MSNLRRYHKTGNIYFLTCVTHGRMPILTDNIDLFWQSLNDTNIKKPFKISAWIIMPDHFHIIIDPHDNDISNTMQRLKMSFAARYRKRKGLMSGRIWQNRFWDHILRDQIDMNRHTDYIHYNPVHHGYGESPFEWKYSSIHEYLKKGQYQADWGWIESMTLNVDFGE